MPVQQLFSIVSATARVASCIHDADRGREFELELELELVRFRSDGGSCSCWNLLFWGVVAHPFGDQLTRMA